MSKLPRLALNTVQLLCLLFLAYQSYGQFTGPTNVSDHLHGPQDVKTADMDNDGDIDIVTATWVDDKIVWYENDNGTFLNQQSIAVLWMGKIQSFQLADLNGDGNIDIVYSQYDNDAVKWIANQGNMVFGPEQTITLNADGANSVFVADLDGDFDLDVVSSSRLDSKIAWYENLGAGLFGAEQLLANNVTHVDHVISVDIDNDMDSDVVAISGDLILFENMGSGVFNSGVNITNNVPNEKMVTAGDLNQDNLIDLISIESNSTGNITLVQNQGGLSFSNQIPLSSYNIHTTEVELSDLDLDGDLDIITYNLSDIPYGPNSNSEDTILIIENLGGGVLASPSPIALVEKTTTGLTHINADDLNGDGFPEIVFTYSGSYSNGVGYLENSMGLNFSQPVILNREANLPTSIVNSDIDNDGWKDIISVSFSDGKLNWYPNQSGSFTSVETIYYFGRNLNEVSVEDMDNDFDTDIIVGSFDSTLWYVENLGSGTFATPTLISTDNHRTTDLYLEDVNNDNLIDIICSSELDDEIGLYLNLGNGSFGAQILLTDTKNQPMGTIAFDYDDDGDIDILATSNIGNNEVFVMLNNGSGVFASPTQVVSLWRPADLIYADVNMDGLPDLIVGRTDFYQDLYWLENQGNGNYSGLNLVNNNIVNYDQLRAEDLDNDGDPDILLITSAMNNAELIWIENLGNGYFGAATVVDNEHYNGGSITIADFDNDGDYDLAASSSGYDNISTYQNKVVDDFQVSGRLFIDLDQDSLFTSSDQAFPQVGVQSTNGFVSNFLFSDGRYYFNYDSTGLTYTVSHGVIPNWGLVTDSNNYTFTVNGNFQSIDSADFGFYPVIFENDMSADLVGAWPRCNTSINFWANFGNIGTTFPEGIIEVILNDSISYDNASVLPDSIVGNKVYWHFDSLNFFETEQQLFQATMPGVNMLNIPMDSYLNIHILDALGNIDTTFSDTLTQLLACAYDPNDKQSDPIGVGPLGYISPNQEYLEYLIRFQNTGNDIAQQVVLTDQLDSNLDWSSFERLSSSHFDYYSLDTASGLLTVTYNNINLPDSTTDFLGSQGYFKFKIRLKDSLAIGTQINNTAQIFFDLNPPIITNTKVNTIYACDQNFDGISDQNLCAFEDLQMLGSLPNYYVWEVSGQVLDSGYIVNWVPQTSGVFAMSINSSNEVCSVDTTITVNVSPNSPPLMLDTTIVCAGDSALIFNQWQSVSGVYSQTLTSVSGCDSILLKELFVIPEIPLQITDTIFVCNGESTSIYGQPISLPGLYYDTLNSVSSCDSIVATFLTFYPDYSNNPIQNVSICDGDSIYLFNQYISSAGVYSDTLNSINGCDSVVTVLLSMQSPQVSFNSNIPDSICLNSADMNLIGATPIGGTYSGNGVMNNTFSPSVAGIGTQAIFYSYTDSLGCSGVDSFMVSIDNCASLDKISTNHFVVSPNPIRNKVKVQFGGVMSVGMEVSILNLLGQEVIRKNTHGMSDIIIDCSSLTSGMYFLRIYGNRGKTVFYEEKVIKVND